MAARAAALNRLDLLQRQGPGLVPGFALPHVAGMDVAGEVVSLGEDVTTVSVGDRVVVNPAVVCGSCDPCSRGDDAYCTGGEVVGANRPRSEEHTSELQSLMRISYAGFSLKTKK